jgi:hypothetical protein
MLVPQYLTWIQIRYIKKISIWMASSKPQISVIHCNIYLILAHVIWKLQVAVDWHGGLGSVLVVFLFQDPVWRSSHYLDMLFSRRTNDWRMGYWGRVQSQTTQVPLKFLFGHVLWHICSHSIGQSKLYGPMHSLWSGKCTLPMETNVRLGWEETIWSIKWVK